MEPNLNKKDSITNLAWLSLVVLLGIFFTIIVTQKVLPHPDEHQFYLNAFQIMAGEELHNYLHVALTEYVLAGFLIVANLFTSTGVNFPQGEPSLATIFYGRILGLFLYLSGFYLSFLVLQAKERGVRIRSVAFAVLYFGSVGIFERFLRINSDSIGMLVFLNFVIVSLWLHAKRAKTFEFFIFTSLFVFLASFTNLKTLFLIFPLFFINLFVPPFFYDENSNKLTGLSPLYKLFPYLLGVVGTSIFLWSQLIPKPFNSIKFWYGIKKTVVHGTRFDFDYPSQAYQSWAVYIYDFFVEYLGLTALLALIILIFVVYKSKLKSTLETLGESVLNQLRIKNFTRSNPYKYTPLILFLSLCSYYVGVSTATVHWSRWGMPIGILGMMLISIFAEHLIQALKTKKPHFKLILFLVFVAWALRGALTIDLIRADYPEKTALNLSTKNVDKFLKEKEISSEDAYKKVAWFTGHTGNVSNISLASLIDEEFKEVEYILWPYWNIGPVYTEKNVDKSTHNQRAFINKYSESIEYRFPNLLSFYMHYTKYFAWRVLGITWNPEIDSLVDTQYAVIKIKPPKETISLSYDVPFSDMSHYYFPHSRVFNLQTLPDGYGFPPCYSYHYVRNSTSGKWSEPPPDIGVGGRTADLNCHTARFRVALKGTYRIRVEGLPDDPDDLQRVYVVLQNFDWDPKTKTATFIMEDTRISVEFGVATTEKDIPNLKFHIFYISDVSEI